MEQRNDDFKKRRKHLENYNDEQLKAYFFELIDKINDPILKLGKEYTTPAIERSILMRMGFSSQEAKYITNKLEEHDLLQFGAGHVVYKYHLLKDLTIRESGIALLEDENIAKIRGEFFETK